MGDLGRSTEHQSTLNHPHCAAFLDIVAGAFIKLYGRTEAEEDLGRVRQLYMEVVKNCPASHPDHLHILAKIFHTQYEQTGKEEDINESIWLYTELLKLLQPGHPDHVAATFTLVSSLETRYHQFGLVEDLDRSIQLLAGLLETYSSSHPQYCAIQISLGAALSSRHCKTGAEEDLKESIHLLTELLELLPSSHPGHVTATHSLATSLELEYRRSGLVDNLERSIQLLVGLLETQSPTHPLYCSFQMSLGNALFSRYQKTGVEGDLKKSIQIFTESLEILPPGHSDHIATTYSLALSLEMEYRQSGLVDSLERSIQLLMGLLETQSPTHPLYYSFQMSLGAALFSQHCKTGAEGDLKESIQLFTELLELLPPSHPDYVKATLNLASSLGTRFRQSGSVDDLDQSIQLLTGLLETQLPTHPLYCSFQISLGNVLFSRYQKTGVEGDLEKNIQIFTELLKILPPGHSDYITATYSLALSLEMQHRQLGLVEDLDRSIQLLTGLMETHSSTHPQYSSFQITLANALLSRHRRIGAEEDLKESVKLCEDLLKLLPPQHPHHVAATFSLAISLGLCHSSQLGPVEYLDRSIQLLIGLLDTQSSTHPEYLSFQVALGSALLSQYAERQVEGDLQRSIQLLSEVEVIMASSASHMDYPAVLLLLGVLFLAQYRHTGREADLEQSLHFLEKGRILCPNGHPLHAAAIYTLTDSLWMARASNISSPSDTDKVFKLLRETSNDFISPLKESLTSTMQWVDFAYQAQDIAVLSEAYEHGIQFLRGYLTIGPTMRLQYTALSRNARILSLPIDAVSHFIQQDNVERAIEILDEGRSLLWSEGQRFRKPLLNNDQLDTTLVERFESTRTELQQISTAEDYNEILNCIRQNPGFEDFLQSSPFEKLKEAAKEGPVIIVNCSTAGSQIIILYANTPPSVIKLEKGFHAKAVEHCQAYLEARRSKVQGKTFRSRLRPILEWLWEDIVYKVVEKLKMTGVAEGSRIWWCPTSVLTVLPFHAAGYETKNTKQYLIDSYISSYTPTLQALIDARRSPQKSIPGQPVKLLVVGQTDLTLKHAEAEVKAIHELGPFVNCLVEKDATQEKVLKGLLSHQWAHFVCHGTLAPLPFDSFLHLFGEDKLTMGDIIKMNHSDASFAFLAACHSAEQTPAGLSDEILHLAGAMLFSGFQSVVGTMWEMVDKDGPNVAKWFYEEMLSDDQPVHTRAAQSLWKVTKRMKDEKKIGRDGKETVVYPLERWVNFIHIGA
ncbi:hypothetical protein L218DRAFT_886742 [Marasmius fiardii PR-910]|nr:hypothetical protein L218DRAFT_886742 [Marasmius fiardii PR-910]